MQVGIYLINSKQLYTWIYLCIFFNLHVFIKPNFTKDKGRYTFLLLPDQNSRHRISFGHPGDSSVSAPPATREYVILNRIILKCQVRNLLGRTNSRLAVFCLFANESPSSWGFQCAARNGYCFVPVSLFFFFYLLCLLRSFILTTIDLLNIGYRMTLLSSTLSQCLRNMIRRALCRLHPWPYLLINQAVFFSFYIRCVYIKDSVFITSLV